MTADARWRDRVMFDVKSESSRTRQPAIVPYYQLTNVVFASTGTASLNVHVLASSNLLTGAWLPASILTNSYSDGTNTTLASLPIEPAMFFQVNQTLP
jgi:hypothetical protein